MSTRETSQRISRQINSLIKKIDKDSLSTKVADNLSQISDSISLRKLKGVLDSAVESCERREAEAKREAEEAKRNREKDDAELMETLRSLPTYKHLSASELKHVVADIRKKAEEPTSKKAKRSPKVKSEKDANTNNPTPNDENQNTLDSTYQSSDSEDNYNDEMGASTNNEMSRNSAPEERFSSF